MTGIRSTIAWVFTDPPAQVHDDAIDFYLIKAANGDAYKNPAGFDFRANYAAWADAHGPSKCAAWTWLYASTDGAEAAAELYESAPHAPCYVIDVEGDDPSGEVVSGVIIRQFVNKLRELAPHAPVGFTSYPTRSQAIAHGAPWDDLIAACDFGMPQIYYQTQGAEWERIRGDHLGKPILAAFAPDDWPDCWVLAGHAASIYGGVSLWRFPGTAGWTDHLNALRADAPPAPPSPPTAPPADTLELIVHTIDLRNAEHTVVEGHGVKPLQLLLDNAGYHVVPDGKGGALTKAALVSFQEHQGIEANGVAGNATFEHLLDR